jgi:uncharacterized membrane protein
METKKNKYDTNPLDPDVERKSQDAWGEEGGGTPTTEWVQQPTQKVEQPSGNESSRKNIYSEAPTRRYDNPPLEQPYPSVFVPPTTYSPPAQYQPKQNIYQPPPHSAAPTSRPILGLGLPEKWALTLAYAPFYIGLVVSLLELFLVPRSEVKVRFHASQAVALNIAVLIIHTLFKAIGAITGSSFGGFIFWLAALIFFIISMVRVSKGEEHRIAPLAEPAHWFNEHIEPRR